MREISAENTVEAGRRAAAIGGRAIFGRRFRTLIVFLELDVQHAGDGIGAIDRRFTAGHDVDSVDQQRRDRIQIDDAGTAGIVDARFRADLTHAIDQGQGAVRTKATEIRRVDVGAIDEEGGVAGALIVLELRPFG
ncbi:MAG: hypothetical protein WCC64_10510 [Aliidongia sp.]